MFYATILTSLALSFQLCLVCAQNLAIQISFTPDSPFNIYPTRLVYDEVAQYMYIAGAAIVAFDGQASIANNGYPDIFLTKMFLNGTHIWSRIVGGTVQDDVFKLIQNPATSELLLFGRTFSNPFDGQATIGGSDCVIMKYAPNGTKLLTRVFGTNYDDVINDAYLDVGNQQLVSLGSLNSVSALMWNDISNGTLLKQITFPVNGAINAFVHAEAAQDCYVTGSVSASFDSQPYSGNTDIFLTKMNYFNGTRYWTRMWGNYSADSGVDVGYDSNSHLVFVAATVYLGSIVDQTAFGDQDPVVICTRDNGTFLWARQFGSSGHDAIFALAIHQPTGAVFTMGYSGPYLAFIVIYAQNGTQIYHQDFPGQSDYEDITFASSNKLAYINDRYGQLVALNISYSLPPVYVTTSLGASTPTPTPLASSVLFPVTTTPVLATTSSVPLISTFSAALSSTSSAAPSSTSSAAPSSTSSSSVTSGIGASSTSPLQASSSSDPPAIFTTSDAFQLNENANIASPSSISHVARALFGASALLLIVLGVIVWCWFRARKVQKKVVQYASDSTTMATATMTDEEQSTSTSSQQTTTNIVSSQYTMAPTYFELSMPGYLMFDSEKSFRLTKKIAQGGGGSVFQADALSLGLCGHGATIIVKTIGAISGMKLEDLSEEQQKSFQQEVAIMHFFRDNKNIAKVLGWSKSPAAIMMKLYSCGSLDKWIHGNTYKSKLYLVAFMQDISRGIMAMHQVGFVHNDLKPQNILVDRDEQDQLFCCLTDFGITQIVDDTTLLVKEFAVINLRGMSIHYAAPEAFQRFRGQVRRDMVPSDMLKKVDLYSFGVIVLELLKRRKPWTETE